MNHQALNDDCSQSARSGSGMNYLIGKFFFKMCGSRTSLGLSLLRGEVIRFDNPYWVVKVYAQVLDI